MKKGYLVRGDIIHINTMIDKEYFRFSTKLKATQKNINFVSKNLLKLIQEYKLKKETLKSLEETSTESLGFYLQRLESCKKGFKQTTLETFKCHKRGIISFFKDKPIGQITRLDIEEFYNSLIERKLKRNTIVSRISVLKRAFNLALEEEVISKNVVFKQRFQNDARLKNPFNLQEVKLILQTSEKYATSDVTNYLKIAFFTGMRKGEILALSSKDIDLENLSIKVSKTLNRLGKITSPKTQSSNRNVDILPPVKNAILELLQKEREFLFGKEISNVRHFATILQESWGKILCECGLEYRVLYHTRHSFASIMLNAGEDLMWVSRKQLGHANAHMTLTKYAEFLESKDKKRAAFLEGF